MAGEVLGPLCCDAIVVSKHEAALQPCGDPREAWIEVPRSGEVRSEAMHVDRRSSARASGPVRRRRMPRPFLVFSLIALMVACGTSGEGQDAAGADRTPTGGLPPSYDSVQLAQDEGVYIGNPYGLVVLHDPRSAVEEVWISDFFSNVLLHFDGDGELRARLGAPGPGPAEFSSAAVIFHPGPEQVAAVDRRQRAVKWFDRASGELERFLRYDTGLIGVTPPVPMSRDRLVFPVLDFESRTSLAILDLTAGTWRRSGPLPEAYHRSLDTGAGGFASFFVNTLVAGLGGSEILIGFSGSEILYRHDVESGASVPLGRIPRRLRRGAADDLWRAFDIPAEYGDGLPFDWASGMDGLGVLSDGRIVAIHADREPEGTGPPVLLRGRHFMTIMDIDADVACVDLPVPGGRDTRSVFAVQDDVLYVLDRRVTTLESEAWLLRLDLADRRPCPEDALVEGWVIQGTGAYR